MTKNESGCFLLEHCVGRLKVIQGQKFWCRLIARCLFPIRLLLTLSSYLSPFLKIFDVPRTVQGHPRSKVGGFDKTSIVSNIVSSPQHSKLFDVQVM